MRVTVNTTEALSFEPTEPGPYEMHVEKYDPPVKSKDGQGSLGTFIYFQFEDPSVQKRCGHVRRWYPLEGKGAGFFRDFWKATTGEDIPVGTTIDVDLDDCLGRPVIADITNEPYEGKLQNNISKLTGR